MKPTNKRESDELTAQSVTAWGKPWWNETPPQFLADSPRGERLEMEAVGYAYELLSRYRERYILNYPFDALPHEGAWWLLEWFRDWVERKQVSGSSLDSAPKFRRSRVWMLKTSANPSLEGGQRLEKFLVGRLRPGNEQAVTISVDEADAAQTGWLNGAADKMDEDSDRWVNLGELRVNLGCANRDILDDLERRIEALRADVGRPDPGLDHNRRTAWARVDALRRAIEFPREKLPQDVRTAKSEATKDAREFESTYPYFIDAIRLEWKAFSESL